jgi:hypothetical protein
MPIVVPFGILLAACFISGLYFLFVLPVIVGVLARAYRKSRKLTTNLSVAVVMLFAFYISVALTWMLITPGWDLSPITTLKAAGALGGLEQAGGNLLDDAAEGILAAILILSTLSTVAAGIVTATARYVWVKSRHLAV